MSNEATPAATTTTEAPVPPAATPSAQTTAEVTLSKEAHDQLQRDAARARENQRKADLFDKMNKKGSVFGAAAPATTLTEEEKVAAAQAEDRKAERGLTRLALDPTYREVLDSDPTLRNLLVENPLAVLPILAPDALDADDALSLVKEALNARKKPAATTTTEPAKPAATTTTTTPPAGAVNTNDKPVNEEVEAAKKIPNTEKSIAAMIGAKVKARNAGK